MPRTAGAPGDTLRLPRARPRKAGTRSQVMGWWGGQVAWGGPGDLRVPGSEAGLGSGKRLDSFI